MALQITFSGQTNYYFDYAFGSPDYSSLDITPTRITLTNMLSGLVTELYGTGLDAGGNTGTITGWTTRDDSGDTVLSATGINWDLASLDGAYDFLAGGSADFDVLTELLSQQRITFDARLAVEAVWEFDFFGVDSRVTMYGSAFGDRMGGGNRSDRIEGRAGSDTLLGYDGDDNLYGGDGRDVLDGGDGGDRLHGDAGNDTLYGEVGRDYLYGGDGNDVLYGGKGGDRIDGGAGRDTVVYRDAPGAVTVDLSTGLSSGAAGADRIAAVENIGGSDFDDSLTGNRHDNLIFGGDGEDTLTSGRGNDALYGNAGHDMLRGGAGNDHLLGLDGDDVLVGQTGNDTLAGGAGLDTLTGNAGADHFVFRNGFGDDVITDFSKGVDTLELDDALWGGGMTRRAVVKEFAIDTGSDILFFFEGGQTILLEGVANRVDLHLDIAFI